MGNVHIRSAKGEDASRVAKIHVETWRYAYRGQISDSYLDSLSIDKFTESWKSQLENPEKRKYAFVIEVNGQVVGWCTVGMNRDEDSSDDTGELYGIYVLPEYIGEGLGSKLLEHGLDALGKDGYRKVTLWVLTSNEKTRKWYELKGWRVEGKTKTDPREDVVLHEIRYIVDL